MNFELASRKQELKKIEDNIVFLDTETTGLHNADAIEIAVVSLSGKGKESYLFNKRIKTRKKIEYKAFEIHGISKEDLINGSTFSKVYEELKEILKDKKVIIYNKDFDFHILKQMCEKIKKPNFLDYENCVCLMEGFSNIYGEYVDYLYGYKWQKLIEAFDLVDKNIVSVRDFPSIKAHTALGDALMSKYVFKEFFISDFQDLDLKNLNQKWKEKRGDRGLRIIDLLDE